MATIDDTEAVWTGSHISVYHISVQIVVLYMNQSL